MIDKAREIELKRCPFCGGEPEFVRFKLSNGDPRGQIRCKTRGCQGRAIGHKFDTETAIESWNSRSIGLPPTDLAAKDATIQQQSAEIEQLQARVKSLEKQICIFGREESGIDFVNDAECLEWFEEYTSI